jgi:hypothetical protein
MTIIENITPENPMEHSFTRYGKGYRGLYATKKAMARWRIALVVARRNIKNKRRTDPMILSNSVPRGTKASMLKSTWSKEPWKRTDV